ncbi:metal ABC transporter substrate-binding protein [Christensenellaceae bacterium OttesenSCG-928-M15]|nr:metal ABC transporter substrate-binding protein [Christensenellaceae bacterium OttesenSCG-928-M15]
MKKILSITMAVILLIGLAACKPAQGTQAASDSGLKVVATIFPAYDFAREIGGQYVSLTMLLPPGSESHGYEPTPRDMQAIAGCDVFLCIGGESEAWVDNLTASIDMEGIAMVRLIEVADHVLEEEHDHAHDGADHSDHDHDESEVIYDEHIWTSPKNALRMCTAISDAFIHADTPNADAYRTALNEYGAKLNELDAAFIDIAQNAARKTLVFGDRFPLRYFEEEYGFDCHSAFPGCSVDAEPSAATVALLSRMVKEEEIPVVFYLEMSNEKMADTLIEGTTAKKRLFHSCHNVTKDEFESGASYLSLMQQNANHVREAVQ